MLLFLRSIYLEVPLKSWPFVFVVIMILSFIILLSVLGLYYFDYVRCPIKTVKGVVVKAMVKTSMMTFPTNLDSSLCLSAPNFQAFPYSYNYMEAKAVCEDGLITFEGNIPDHIFKQIKEGSNIRLFYKEGHKRAVSVQIAA